MNLQTAIKGQYHAGMAMLKEAIEQCPEELWTAGGRPSPFWQAAYHAIFFTHLYLQSDEAAFRPWAGARENYHHLETLPWPPHDKPKLDEPYTRAEVLDYWLSCEEAIDAAVDSLDLTAGGCGFGWYDMPKLDHQLVNLRHLQHHVGDLAGRLRAAGVERALEWVGRKL